ncbi:hypothetical protein AM233_10165 [Bacillus sp. FJAT-22058]|nr:hypothetical protein AM233_10165 [Bacillus sp. FJAT-22058]
MHRSEAGLKIQLDECLEALSFSLNHVNNKKSLNKVLAVQLRILLCDTKFNIENSLINKVIPNPSLDCVNNNFISYENKRFIEYIPSESLFKKNESQLPLKSWLSQKVIKSNISYETLDCKCPYCANVVGAIKSNNTNIKVQDDKCLVTMICHNCGAYFNVNLDDIVNAYEGKIENVKRTTITIRDIIKNYANKNGGAHVDSVLDIKGFLIAELGDKYIQAISKYIVEYFSKIKIS